MYRIEQFCECIVGQDSAILFRWIRNVSICNFAVGSTNQSITTMR